MMAAVSEIRTQTELIKKLAADIRRVESKLDTIHRQNIELKGMLAEVMARDAERVAPPVMRPKHCPTCGRSFYTRWLTACPFCMKVLEEGD